MWPAPLRGLKPEKTNTSKNPTFDFLCRIFNNQKKLISKNSLKLTVQNEIQ